MSIEQAHLARVRPYMLSAQAADIISVEAHKGCEPFIASEPIALEPAYEPIGEALAEAIAECVAHADTSAEYRVFTKEHDRIYVVPTADEREVRMLLQTGADTVRRLRRGLANALRSSAVRVYWITETRPRVV